MAISSITYVLQFILIDFNDNHPHKGIITILNFREGKHFALCSKAVLRKGKHFAT